MVLIWHSRVVAVRTARSYGMRSSLRSPAPEAMRTAARRLARRALRPGVCAPCEHSPSLPPLWAEAAPALRAAGGVGRFGTSRQSLRGFSAGPSPPPPNGSETPHGSGNSGSEPEEVRARGAGGRRARRGRMQSPSPVMRGLTLRRRARPALQVDLQSKYGSFSELYWSLQERKARLFLFLYRKWCVRDQRSDASRSRR